MAKYIDLTGQRFGKLTVLQKSEKRLSNKLCWECICDCGNTITVRGECLRSGHTKTCGCSKAPRNLIGKKFGELTVIKDTPKRNNSGEIIWECKCSCGNITYIPTSRLTGGFYISCGCASSRGLRRNENKRENLLGQKFGKLIVIDFDKEGSALSNKSKWICKCECGNICSKRIDVLHSPQGQFASCGCDTRSKGESLIRSLLTKYNISFIEQKTFESCRFIETGYLARFDFFVENNYLIEYDGEQHFYYSGTGWDTKEQFEITKQRDNFKNEWCKANNIPIIRIPYTQLSKLKIEDLILETSSFVKYPEE